MKVVDLAGEHEALHFVCLEDWSDEMKEAGNHKDVWYHRMKDKHEEYKPPTAEATLALKQSLRFGNVAQRTFFVGKNGNLITVFNDGWSLDTEGNVIAVSKNSSKTFLAVAVYDDDVLVLSIVKGGVALTRHCSGAAEAYGMVESLGDTGLIAETFGIPGEKERLEKVLRDDDLWKKVSDLEELLNMKLWIISDDDVREMGWKKVTVRPPKGQINLSSSPDSRG